MLSMSMRMEQSFKQLPDIPATGSIFKNVNLRLNESEYQKALKFIGAMQDMERYVDMVDFLFCECFPNPWKKKCFDYYNDEGTQLKDDPDMIAKLIPVYDQLLCLILDLAVECSKTPFYRRKRKNRWYYFNVRIEWLLTGTDPNYITI